MASCTSVAVLGPGLLGGSVALAARAKGCADEVRIWARREAAIEQISSLGIADVASTDLAEVVAGAQLIVLATPVGIMPGLVERLLGLPLAGPVVITDLGSVKGSVVRPIDALLTDRDGIEFVGSHPMAGKEQAGIEHATAELFEGAACVLTPGESGSAAAVDLVEEFWQGLGCRTLKMQPDEHDAAVARVSHLPHLAASLVAAAALGDDPSIGKIAGAGLRDTTRVASGPPDMWAEILLENREALAPALDALAENFSEASKLLESGDSSGLRQLLQEAKELRDALAYADAD